MKAWGKFSEAKYFLSQMSAHRHDPPKFRWSLSAFLGAARSVTWAMQAELARVPGFRNWYAEKQNELIRDSDLRLFNEKRREEVHGMGLNVLGRVRAQIERSATYHGAVNTPHTAEDLKKRLSWEIAAPTLKVIGEPEWLWYFDLDSIPRGDILSLAMDHLEKLKELLTECESKFKQGQAHLGPCESLGLSGGK